MKQSILKHMHILWNVSFISEAYFENEIQENVKKSRERGT